MSRKTSLGKGTALGYRGDVKIATYIGEHLLSTKTYRNKGALPLFQFLANCLAGNFPAAYTLRPYKIKLLKIPVTDEENNTILPDEFSRAPKLLTEALATANSAEVECTDFINMAAAPEIIVQENDKGYTCKVSFSFVFPYARLRRTGANMVAIYGPGISSFREYSAYYLLTQQVYDAEGKSYLDWDPVELPVEEDELNKIFAVEWTMTLSNQN